MGNALRSCNKTEEAIIQYEKAANSDPKDPNGPLNLAHSYKYLNQG